MIIKREKAVIVEQMMDRCRELGHRTDAGSLVRTLGEEFAGEVEGLYDAILVAVEDGKLSTATEDALNAFGVMLRLPRQIVRVRDEAGLMIERLQNDEEYRYALLMQFDALAKANEVAVRLAALLVPGVKDVIHLKYALGPGSFIVIPILLPGFEESDVIGELENAYESNKAEGIRHKIRTSLKKMVDISLLLVGTDITLATRDRLRLVVRDYIEGLDPGQPLIWFELMGRIKASAQEVVDIEVDTLKVNGKLRPIGNINVENQEELIAGKIAIN